MRNSLVRSDIGTSAAAPIPEFGDDGNVPLAPLVEAASRTDAGVHASCQVIHFDSDAVRSPRNWIHGANANLPPDISLSWVLPVEQDFHARFSAQARRYRYVIYNDPVRPAHLAHEVTWNYRPLDIERMRAAAKVLVGTHDFTSYRAVGCQAKSPIKTIHHLELLEFGRFIVLDIRANAFLHHMVRNIAGVLMQIGCGEQPVGWAAQAPHTAARSLRLGQAPGHPCTALCAAAAAGRATCEGMAQTRPSQSRSSPRRPQRRGPPLDPRGRTSSHPSAPSPQLT